MAVNKVVGRGGWQVIFDCQQLGAHSRFSWVPLSPSTALRQGQSSMVTTQGSSSVRAPSATMAVVLVGQIQFLATLSLVEPTGNEDSWVLDFAENLRSEESPS